MTVDSPRPDSVSAPGLRERIERTLGRHVPVRYLSELHEVLSPRDKKKAQALLERNGRLVDMNAVLAGEEKPTGALVFVVSEYRNGLLIQLYEGLCKI